MRPLSETSIFFKFLDSFSSRVHDYLFCFADCCCERLSEPYPKRCYIKKMYLLAYLLNTNKKYIFFNS